MKSTTLNSTQAEQILPALAVTSGLRLIFQPRRKTRPTNTAQNLSQQHQNQLLKMLLALTGGGLVGLISLTLVAQLPRLNFSVLLPQLIALALIILCQTLNRFVATRIVAVVFLAMMVVINALYLITRPDPSFLLNLRGVAPLMAIPVVAAGVILGPIYSFVFAFLSIFSILGVGFYRARPGLAALETPNAVIYECAVLICLLLVMASLAWFFESNFRSLISQLTTQNQHLNNINQELAHKIEIEGQLSQQVDVLTTQVSVSSELQNQAITEQLMAVYKVSTTLEQFNQTNEIIAAAAQQVNITAQEALQVAEDGTAFVRSGLASLEMVSNNAETIAITFNELFTQAHQINQIIELLDDITEATSLLALNATIEAAGAGEYGRRFGAVAREVQSLARRSQLATEQVYHVVTQVQQAIEEAVKLAQRGVNETTSVMKHTRSMETALEGIVIMVENTAQLARDISISIHEQRSATAELVEPMQGISIISTTIKLASQDLLAGIRYLGAAVTRLNSAR